MTKLVGRMEEQEISGVEEEQGISGVEEEQGTSDGQPCPKHGGA